jgi:hypothetical protein
VVIKFLKFQFSEEPRPKVGASAVLLKNFQPDSQKAILAFLHESMVYRVKGKNVCHSVSKD